MLEYDTPKQLLSNEESDFSKMVQSTGVANAQYLHKLVFEGQDNIGISKEMWTYIIYNNVTKIFLIRTELEYFPFIYIYF